MSSNGFDFIVTKDELQTIADRHELEDPQPYTFGDGSAGIVHRSDTRPELLTHDLATLIATKNLAHGGGVTADEVREVISDLEPVAAGDGTRWRNVGVQ